MPALRDLRDVLVAKDEVFPAKESTSERRPEILLRLAVVVGIGIYPRQPLKNAPHDAKAVAELLERDYGFRVTILDEEKATRQAIEQAVVADLTTADDKTQWVFYFAGHGWKTGDRGYLIPSDGCPTDPESCLAVDWLQERCIGSRCAEILIILDACKAGQALVRAEDLDGPMSPDPEKRRRIRQIFCAANPDQYALDGDGREPYSVANGKGKAEHSIFTASLLEALKGQAGAHDIHGAVRFGPLMDYVVEEVERRLIAAGVPQGRRQKPIGGHFAGNDEQRGFAFKSLVPRVLPATVRAVSSDEPPQRLDGLDRLLSDCRSEPGRLPSAIPLVEKCRQPERGRDERVRAAKTLCHLARIGGAELEWPSARKEVDSRLGEIFCELAVEDRSPAVRNWARRGLCRTGKDTRTQTAGCLRERYRTSPSARCRALAAGVLLPEARRRLPWTTWWRIPLAWMRLWAAALVWALVETKTRRRWLTGTSVFTALFYLGLGSAYYFSLWDQSTIVVRLGVPGLAVLPGVGTPLVMTGYGVQSLKDPRLVREERLRGFWLRLRGGALPWAKQLFEQLEPAEAGLAEWRMGDEEQALARFQEGIAAGDPETVPLVGYLALQSASAVRPAVILLVQALQGDEKLHEPALTALAVVRDARPAAAQAALLSLAQRLRGVSGAEAVALIEAVEVLHDPQWPGGSPVPAALLHLLRAHPADFSLRLRIVRALKSLVGRDPARLASVLLAVRASLLHGSKDEQGAWLSILESPAPLPPPVERSVVDVLADTLAAETDPAKRIVLLRALGSRLARSPSLAASYVPVLRAHLGALEPGLRLTAARALASLPAGMVPSEAIVGMLADLILSGEGTALRTDAVEILGDLQVPDSRQAAIGALIAAAGAGNSFVREQAAISLVDKGLASGESAQRIVPVLRSLVADPVPSIRLAAAQGVLLLSQSSGEDETAAFGELARALGSDDPREERNLRISLMEWLPRASRENRRRLLQQLAAHAGTLNLFTAHPIFDLLEEKAVTDLLPDLALAFASLLGDPGAAPDVQDRARIRLWELGRRPEALVAPALAALFDNLGLAGERDRAAAAEAVGYLAAEHPRQAVEAARALAPLLTDPSTEVQAKVATALGVIGGQQAQTVRSLLDPLLTGLSSRSPAVRTACAKALGDLDLAPSLARRVSSVLLVAVKDPDPAVRREAVSAVVHWGRRAWREMGSALPRLQEQIKSERDPEVMERLRSALAVLGGGDPEIARQVLGLSASWLASGKREQRLAAVWLLRRLGETHPASGRQVVAALRPLLRDADEGIRRDVLVVLYLIGAADVDNGALVMDAVGPLLLDPEWPGRWDAIANHLRPLVRERAVLAPRAIHWLRELVASGTLEQRFLGPQAVEALIESLTLQARTDPEAPWPLLVSPNGFERQVGREVLSRLAAERPEQIPAMLARLAGYRRSLFPHVRLSAAEAAEMISLLRRTREVEGTPAAKPWRKVLESLPSRANVGAAVRLALDRLEPGVQHG